MWYKEDPKGLGQQELINLYNVIDTRERGFREDLFRFTNFYSAVCIAILWVTLSGLLTLHDEGKLLLLLLLGPVTCLAMCWLGLRVTGQIYRRIQHETSAKAKLENVLGLDGELCVVQFLGEKTIWKEDESILPVRHAKRRFEESSSREFVDRGSTRKGGVNVNNKIYFGIIASAAIFLGAAIVVMGFIAG